jgi:hypothetical protein
LATTGGRMTTTGVAGFTPGSGSGWLERLHGLACDNVLSAKVVTADGRILTASETEHTDLFSALRGGGRNFGVATECELRLHRVGPMVYVGLQALTDRATLPGDGTTGTPTCSTTSPTRPSTPSSPPPRLPRRRRAS